MHSAQNFLQEELPALLDQYRQFVSEELFPIDLQVVQGPFKTYLPKLNTLRAKAKSLGLFAPHLSKEDGGVGLNLVQFAQVSEILGQSPIGHYVFNCAAPDIGNMELLHLFGSEEQNQTWLIPLQRGEIRSCFAMTEPAMAGSNPVHLGTMAVREGDEYVINGHKWFTTAADGAKFTIVMAVTNPEAASPYQKASMILVPLDNPGYKLVRNIPIMGEAGEDYLSHGEVKFENCRVPVSNLIGKEGQGFALAQERLGPGRIHHCMRLIGTAERALEDLCKRVQSREAFGKKISEQGVVREWIADSRIEIEQARLLTLKAAYMMDTVGNKEAKAEIAMIKVIAPAMALKVIDRAIQAFGAAGVSEDTPLAALWANARTLRLADGPDEVHKAQLARLELKPYQEKEATYAHKGFV